MANGFSMFSSARTIDPMEYWNTPGNNLSQSNVTAAKKYMESEAYQEDLKKEGQRFDIFNSMNTRGPDQDPAEFVQGEAINPYVKATGRDGDYYVVVWRDGTQSRYYEPTGESWGIQAFKGLVGAALVAATAYVGGGLVGAIAAPAEAGGGAAAGGGITGFGAGEEAASGLLAAEGTGGAGVTGFGAGEEAANVLLSSSAPSLTEEAAWAVAPEAASAAGVSPVTGTASGVPIGSLAGESGNALLNLASNTPVSSLAGGKGTGTSTTASSTNGLVQAGVPLLTSGLNYLVTSDAARRAANTQSDAADAATNAIMTQYWQNRADLAPWREAGVNALSQLVSKVNAGPGTFTESPGYQFRLSEGNKAIERSAAARGKQLSGATMKALDRYSQDYATSDYDNFLRRYYESLNPIQSLAGVGQTAVTNTAAMGTNAATQNAQNILTSGNAQASGAVNQANAITGAINSGLNNYLMWKYLNQ